MKFLKLIPVFLFLFPLIARANSVNSQTIYSNATVTADTNSNALQTEERASEPVFELTATFNSGTSTLDETIQHSSDGTNWATICTFTQVTTTSSNQRCTPALGTNLLRYIRSVQNVGVAGDPSYGVVVKYHFRRSY